MTDLSLLFGSQVGRWFGSKRPYRPILPMRDGPINFGMCVKNRFLTKLFFK